MTALGKTMPPFTYSYCPKYVQPLYPAGATWKLFLLQMDVSYGGWDSGMDGQCLDGWTPDELLEGKTAQCVALGFWGFFFFFPALPRGCWQHQLNHFVLHFVFWLSL